MQTENYSIYNIRQHGKMKIIMIISIYNIMSLWTLYSLPSTNKARADSPEDGEAEADVSDGDDDEGKPGKDITYLSAEPPTVLNNTLI